MAKEWSIFGKRKRVMELLKCYPSGAQLSEIANRMPSCPNSEVRDTLRQLTDEGLAVVSGPTTRKFYALNTHRVEAAIMAKLWRREPVFTEPRDHIK